MQGFGEVDGTLVHEVTIRSRAGAEARILTWGAVIRDLVVPARAGQQRVVLGLERIEDYVAHSPYFGAIVGRYANRIGEARFTLNGETHRLDVNWAGRHQLHGGSRGFGSRIWSLVDRTPSSATLALVSPDGDMGYPGRLAALCSYAFEEPATLKVTLEAACDRPTPVNLTTHGYFNLDGSPTVADHHLMIAGDFITPTTPDLIPTGEIRTVAETPYDFRTLRPIGPATEGAAYDTNFVLRGGPEHPGALAHAATLLSRRSGVMMELWTTEPGLQFYDGHLLDMTVPGLGGATYRARAGLCLEPQRFPDGPNRAHFPPCILEPGQVSRQASELRFSTVDPA